MDPFMGVVAFQSVDLQRKFCSVRCADFFMTGSVGERLKVHSSTENSKLCWMPIKTRSKFYMYSNRLVFAWPVQMSLILIKINRQF